VKAVDEIRASGVERIGLLTEKIPSRSPGTQVTRTLN